MGFRPQKCLPVFLLAVACVSAGAEEIAAWLEGVSDTEPVKGLSWHSQKVPLDVRNSNLRTEVYAAIEGTYRRAGWQLFLGNTRTYTRRDGQFQARLRVDEPNTVISVRAVGPDGSTERMSITISVPRLSNLLPVDVPRQCGPPQITSTVEPEAPAETFTSLTRAQGSRYSLGTNLEGMAAANSSFGSPIGAVGLRLALGSRLFDRIAMAAAIRQTFSTTGIFSSFFTAFELTLSYTLTGALLPADGWRLMASATQYFFTGNDQVFARSGAGIGAAYAWKSGEGHSYLTGIRLDHLFSSESVNMAGVFVGVSLWR